MGKRWLVPVSLAAAALIATGCGSSSTSNSAGTGGGGGGSQSSAAAGTTLKTAKIGGVSVLTNVQGFTLYWFVPDTSTTSKCTSSECVKFWPPVPAPAVAGPGVIGRIGTITRTDGSSQATWNGHPLYTYKGDTAPGQAKGNGLNISGGVWHEVTVSGTVVAPNPSKSSKSGGGGGGYGY